MGKCFTLESEQLVFEREPRYFNYKSRGKPPPKSGLDL